MPSAGSVEIANPNQEEDWVFRRSYREFRRISRNICDFFDRLALNYDIRLYLYYLIIIEIIVCYHYTFCVYFPLIFFSKNLHQKKHRGLHEGDALHSCGSFHGAFRELARDPECPPCRWLPGEAHISRDGGSKGLWLVGRKTELQQQDQQLVTRWLKSIRQVSR